MSNATFLLMMTAAYGPVLTWMMTVAYYQRKLDLMQQRQLHQQQQLQVPEPYRRLSHEEWRADFERRHGLS